MSFKPFHATMIPISTDAPIYHNPFATVAMIVLNSIMFIGLCQESDSTFDEATLFRTSDGRTLTEEQLDVELENIADEEQVVAFLKGVVPVDSSFDWKRALSVEFDVIRPWQWVTGNFMHDGWMHLIGNMIFLWGFGLVVEGKVGPWVFLSVYLGIGTLYGFVLQILALSVGAEGYALGASAVIFGLLALCVAWAPANEFEVLWFFGLRGGLAELSILTYGAIFLAKEFLFFALQGFAMSSELLHILGFCVALPVGLWMVKSGKVDCEGWDIFSYLAGTTDVDRTIALRWQAAWWRPRSFVRGLVATIALREQAA